MHGALLLHLFPRPACGVSLDQGAARDVGEVGPPSALRVEAELGLQLWTARRPPEVREAPLQPAGGLGVAVDRARAGRHRSGTSRDGFISAVRRGSRRLPGSRPAARPSGRGSAIRPNRRAAPASGPSTWTAVCWPWSSTARAPRPSPRCSPAPPAKRNGRREPRLGARARRCKGLACCPLAHFLSHRVAASP